LDTAHNAESARELAAVVAAFDGAPKVLVWGMSAEKDAAAFAREAARWADVAVATAASHPRALAAEELVAASGNIFKSIEAAPSPAEALARGRAAAAEDGLVVVAGSFYLAGEILTLLEGPLE
jgi:dihydrofolate synthase/folylpolyglutamate synthase